MSKAPCWETIPCQNLSGWVPQMPLFYDLALAPAGTRQPSISCVAGKHPINSSILVFNPPQLCRTKSPSATLSTQYLLIELICRVFPKSVFLISLVSGPGRESRTNTIKRSRPSLKNGCEASKSSMPSYKEHSIYVIVVSTYSFCYLSGS